jgi:hypothetical protein
VTIVMLIERVFSCPTHTYGLDPSLRIYLRSAMGAEAGHRFARIASNDRRRNTLRYAAQNSMPVRHSGLHPQHFADQAILPIETLDLVVTADKMDTPMVY